VSNINRIGFGTYRTSLNVEEHFEALKYALESGIGLIDTSANYMDGEAEKLIGKVLRSVDIPREALTIVSKGGYIQGKNMERYRESTPPEVVRYDKSCYHSIHPLFLKEQIELTLNRLRVDYIDIYLLHNPEYYLMDAIREVGADTIAHHKEMQRRIYEAFIHLEKEVAFGRIRGYGISSNSFAKKEEDPHFLEYKFLIDFAEAAAKAVGNPKHSLKALQLPMNYYEQDGEACAKWAKEQGLSVLINRPLNAFDGKQMIRLAEYQKPADYITYLNIIKALIESHKAQALNSFIDELDKYSGEFPWAGGVEDVLYSQIIPRMNAFLREMQVSSEEERNELVDMLNNFLKSYQEQAKYLVSKRCKEEIGIDENLSTFAIKHLLEKEYIDYVLVGMRKKEYVDDILSVI